MKKFSRITYGNYGFFCSKNIFFSSLGLPTNNVRNDLDMSFMVEGEEVSLTLEENPHIPSDFPVILRKNGQFQNWTGQANVSMQLYT